MVSLMLVNYMAEQPNFLTVQAASKEKDCTPQALYKALDEGRLHEIKMGATRLILRDETYLKFEVRSYADKRLNESNQSGEE